MISTIKAFWMSLCSKNNRRFYALSLLLTGLISASPSRAQDITEITPLSYGEIALTSYGNVARITITGSGSVNTNAYVYLISQPARGEYTVTGAPPNSAYTITTPPSADIQGPGGRYFTLDNFDISPALHVTNAAGEDTFYMGARLQSQGGGVVYMDGVYDGVVTLTLAF